MSLGELLTQPTLPEPNGRVIAAHIRKPATRRSDDEAVPFFDETKLINNCTLEAHDPFSKQPDYKKCAVRVVKKTEVKKLPVKVPS